ncbi:MAG: MFS transporter, partial [Chloroflexi bacterium]|nr:MFS transporter [Chloroflexota bacterium]
GLLISGIGLGLLLPNLNLWLVSVIPPAVRGRAIGGLATVVSMGQFLSPIATQPVEQHIGLASVFIAGGGVMLLLALILYGGGRLVRSKNGERNQTSAME